LSSKLLDESLLNPLENFVIPKQRFNPSSPSAFQMLEHHVMPLRGHHPEVVRREVCLVTIAVMHNFTRLEVAFKKLLSTQPVNSHRLAITPHSRVRVTIAFHTVILTFCDRNTVG
jgi:hypothetical protein